MNKWKELLFKKIILNESVSYGIVQPGNSCPEKSTPILRVNNLKNGRLNAENILYVDKNIEEKYLRTRLKGGELLITVVGNVGETLIAPISIKGWNVARAIAVCNISENFDKHFISYQFQSEDVKFQIYGRTNDTVQPTLNLSDLKEISFKIPPLAEQKAIAAVLGSLDDKIDLLHRQNGTLERMAETLFRQWFIEEAQEGWDIKPLTYIANFLNGLACQKFPPQNDIDKLPVLKIRELNNGISEDSDFASSCVGQEYIIHAGDVIFSWSGSLLVKIWHGEDCILNQHLFKVYSSSFPKWFYYFWCKHHLLEFSLIAESHATTMGHIKRRDLEDAEVLVPDRGTLENMTKVIAPLFEKLLANTKQIRTLEKLRDTLLPKLMSGEVRVRVAE